MKGLLLKDFYMSAKYCRAFLVIVAVFLVISFWGDDNLFFIVYPSLIAGIIPMSLISYDERDKWNQYSGTLPYTRSQLVSCKYLIGLIYGAGAYLLSMTATVIRMLSRGYFSWMEFGVIQTMLLAFGLIGPSLLLPFVFRFGPEKGRLFFYAMIAFICAIGAVLAGMGIENNLPTGTFWILGLICLAFVGIYALSWRLSIHFYQKREL